MEEGGGADGLVPPPAGPQVTSVMQVLQTIRGVLDLDPGVRASCETLLRTWEADAVPGFLASLMQIVEQVGAVEEVRAGAHGAPRGSERDAACCAAGGGSTPFARAASSRSAGARAD